MGRGVNRWRFIPRRVLERRAAQDVTGVLAPASRLRSCAARRCASCVAAGLMLALALPGDSSCTSPAATTAASRSPPRRRAACTSSRRRSARARSRRTRSSIDTHRPGGASRPARSSPPQRRLVAELRRDPGDRARARSLAPAARRRRARRPRRRTSSTPTGRVAADPRRRAQRRRRRSRPMDLVAPHPRPLRPGGRASRPATDVLRHRRARLRRRLHRQGLRRVPVARARGARALLPAPAARVPLGRAAAQGRDHEPALGRARPTACWCSPSSTAGASRSGCSSSPQIEAWIPIFLFAMLFGLSMDYEVFLLSRMREEWDRRHDNERAVAYGLEHTGRIITAAAIIMIAAFSGLHRRQLRRAAGVRPRAVGRDPARRDDRPRDPRAGDDEAARATGTGTCPSACAGRCGCRAPRRARPSSG